LEKGEGNDPLGISMGGESNSLLFEGKEKLGKEWKEGLFYEKKLDKLPQPRGKLATEGD